ncbi:hypothetical protein [Roseburia intestinalis]
MPLLGLGGSEKDSKSEKSKKIREYIELISQLVGKNWNVVMFIKEK